MSKPPLLRAKAKPSNLKPLSVALVLLSVTVGPVARAADISDGNLPVAQRHGFAAESRHRFDIPAQPLSGALAAFARQAGLQLSLEAGLVDGLQAPALVGQYSLGEGLRHLLAGSPIAWRIINAERTLVLSRRIEFTTVDLESMVIQDSSLELADGLVDGYRATRSATGTKTDTALRDIPQSVQVVPREVLQDQQATRLNDALTNVSSVQPSSSRGGSTDTFVVRGFRAISYAVDGVMTNPLAERPEVVRDLGNVERVEVLKGPASVLYGRGDPGGLINMVTRRPTFDPQARVHVQAGTYDFYRLEADVGGALDKQETLAGRLTVAS